MKLTKKGILTTLACIIAIYITPLLPFSSLKVLMTNFDENTIYADHLVSTGPSWYVLKNLKTIERYFGNDSIACEYLELVGNLPCLEVNGNWDNYAKVILHGRFQGTTNMYLITDNQLVPVFHVVRWEMINNFPLLNKLPTWYIIIYAPLFYLYNAITGLYQYG